MILLDTNVVSESLRGPRNSELQRWLNAQRLAELFLCTPVLAELRYGIERLPVGRRRDILDEAVRNFQESVFADRVIPVDRDCAHAYGRILAQRERRARPIGIMDALIAAVALAHGATLATRDVSGFDHLGIDLVNPFVPA
ncbi:MAG: PIN domain-containing protein [Rhizobiales bacterium]|nr:PIN domain-containing protein [Hyphomicrobiales bacterium]